MQSKSGYRMCNVQSEVDCRNIDDSEQKAVTVVGSVYRYITVCANHDSAVGTTRARRD
jgi:hypothetical protein